VSRRHPLKAVGGLWSRFRSLPAWARAALDTAVLLLLVSAGLAIFPGHAVASRRRITVVQPRITVVQVDKTFIVTLSDGRRVRLADVIEPPPQVGRSCLPKAAQILKDEIRQHAVKVMVVAPAKGSRGVATADVMPVAGGASLTAQAQLSIYDTCHWKPMPPRTHPEGTVPSLPRSSNHDG
jgi:hypothetical protein